MAKGNWTVGCLPGKRFSCFAELLLHAGNAARSRKKAVLVTYHGPRPPNNRATQQSNFRLFPDGRHDHSVDPTWHTNRKKKKKP